MNFDSVARKWDDKRRINRAEIIANKIKEEVPYGKNISAMEFGCGTGLVSFNLYNSFGNISLIDSSQEMINVVNDKIIELNVQNIKPYYANFLNNKLQEHYDVIYSSMVLHHINDIDKTIQILCELLNDNGCLCIVDLDEEDGSFHKNEVDFRGHNGFNQEQLKFTLEMNGFKNVKHEIFYKDTKQSENKSLMYSLFIMTAIKC